MSFSWTKRFKKQSANLFEWGSQTFYDADNNELTTRSLINPPSVILFDEHGNSINATESEYPEQCLSFLYVDPNSTVLELGARYGSVSCIINRKLTNKQKLEVVQYG